MHIKYTCFVYFAIKWIHQYIYLTHCHGDHIGGVQELKERYGKRMKYSVKPQLLCVLKIDEIIYEILKKNPFSQGVNSDGNERKPKLKVQKDMINALTIYSQQIF